MPYCQIPNGPSLHFITNTLRGDTLDLDPQKPTTLLLPHNLTDVTWLREQFQDTRLSSRYNLIAFDLCHMGGSKASFDPKRDAWVDAADVAVAHEVLQLPPCHLFASGTGGCAAAMSFAILFPEKCLSLFLCSFPVQRGDIPDWIVQDHRELLELWCFPRDLETFHFACEIMVDYFLNNQAAVELQKELVGWWQRHYCPRNRSSYLFSMLRSINTPRYSDKQLQAIRAPTFVVQGDKSLAQTPEYARTLSDKIPNSNFLAVQGGPHCLTIVPEYASVVNRVFVQFLSSLPSPPAHQVSPPDPDGVCKTALARFAALVDDSDMAQRDPTTTLSFSRASCEDVKTATELYNRCSRGEGDGDAINILNERGEPILFSEKFMDADYIRQVKTPPMPAETEIVLVESCTILETEA